MKKITVIQKIKEVYQGKLFLGTEFDDKNTRDQILYGHSFLDDNCTGIVTTIWASVDVIKKAHELGANLIVCHEALFWNHGDHQEWLEHEKIDTYLRKRELLDKYQITVWRNHDYAHSGIVVGNKDVDAIFYGLAKVLGWENYIIGDKSLPLLFEIPETTAEDLSRYLIDKLNLNGVRLIGNKQTTIKKVKIPFHIFGDANEDIKQIDKEEIDAILPLEMVDYSLAEYIKDASLLGKNKVAISMGHFNLEEPGMAYMAKYLKNYVDNSIPVHYVQAGDTYDYITKETFS